MIVPAYCIRYPHYNYESRTELNIRYIDSETMQISLAKTLFGNLIRYVPSGIYFGRVKVGGKLIRRSLDAHVEHRAPHL